MSNIHNDTRISEKEVFLMLCALGAQFACISRALRVGVALQYLAEHCIQLCTQGLKWTATLQRIKNALLLLHWPMIGLPSMLNVRFTCL